MKIAITGASGFIGKKLIERFKLLKWEVIPLNRVDLELGEDWLAQKIDKSNVIINLAGAPIAKKWTKQYKEILYNSRIQTTCNLQHAINKLERKPELFISTSAIGIYDSFHEHDEESNYFADNFLAHICKDWEKEALKSESKTIIFRLSVVLDKNFGAFPKMLFPFKLGLGGKIGNGKQFFSWIHIEDLINAVVFVIENKSEAGIYNLASPNPVTNIELTRLIAGKLKKPAFFTVPQFIFKILFGEGSIVVSEGQKVVPEKLLSEGFVFKHPSLKETIEYLID